jgi:hypothetical protein
LLLDYFIRMAGSPMPHHHGGHAMMPGFVQTAAGVILLAVLAWAYLGKFTRPQR